MQNSQEINWLLEFIKIAIPSLVALFVPLLTYLWLTRKMADYQTTLSKELEDYKKDLSKELESYKIQLQSDFQTKFYEFQTRFSLYHQKKAEAIEVLFTLLAKMQYDLHLWVLWDELGNNIVKRGDTKEDLVERIYSNNNLTQKTFDEKRIFFDENIKHRVLEIGRNITNVLTNQNLAEDLKRQYGRQSNLAQEMNNYAQKDVLRIYPLMTELEKQFKMLLSAENPNN